MACRLCGTSGSLVEMISFNGFPKAAQFLPSESELKNDVPVKLSAVECTYCGLVQLTNKPVFYYKDVITAASLTGVSRKKLSKEFEDIIMKFSLKDVQMLEIGSGDGQFLSVLRELGLKAQGLEHSHANVEKAESKGLNIAQGYLLDNPKMDKKFGFIICNNFMEHQPDIKKFLRKIHGALAPKGFVYISVPNLQRIVEKACFYEFVVDHLAYFSRKTLKLALEISGFDVKRLYFKNNKNDIVVVAKKRSPRALKNRKKKMEMIVESLQSLVASLTKAGKRVSIWGAGHRALALMAISNVKGVDFVIDSAAFKQGKYTPLLNKKIISPQYFTKRVTCDYLIVMLPGSLSEQVRKYLKQENFVGNILYFNDEKIELET